MCAGQAFGFNLLDAGVVFMWYQCGTDMRAGQVFSFDLLDAGGGEIRCTAFNACVDRFEPLIQRDAVIILSKASLRPKKPGTVRPSPFFSPHPICLRTSCVQYLMPVLPLQR